MRSLLIRQALSEQNGGSECAGLCGNRNLGLIEVVPDLYGDETDQQAEDDPKFGSIAGENALNARARSPTASRTTTR